MSSLVIKSAPNNPRVLKSKLTAAFNGVTIKEDNIEFGKDNKEESFLKVNPFGQVPTLFVDGNSGVFESNSIARYVARLGESKQKLYGNNALEASRIDAFLDAECSVSPYIGQWVYPNLGYGTLDVAKVEEGKTRTKKYLLGLNKALEAHPYLAGKEITLADFVWYCSLIAVSVLGFTEEYTKDIPNVTAWMKRVHDLPQVAPLADPVIGDYDKRFKEFKEKQNK